MLINLLLIVCSFFERNDPASQVLSQLQDSGRISVEEDLLRQTDGKTIQQIKDLAQVYL